MTYHGLKISREKIAEFCRKNHINKNGVRALL